MSDNIPQRAIAALISFLDLLQGTGRWDGNVGDLPSWHNGLQLTSVSSRNARHHIHPPISNKFLTDLMAKSWYILLGNANVNAPTVPLHLGNDAPAFSFIAPAVAIPSGLWKHSLESTVVLSLKTRFAGNWKVA